MEQERAEGAIGVYGHFVPKTRMGTISAGKQTYLDIISGDGDIVPPILRPRNPPEVASPKISYDRYFDPRFVALEIEHIWNKMWQVACREEDIPNVGDRIRYDIVDASFLIVRSAPDTIKAFYNSCRHRGRALCDGKGSGTHLRCPFHAWTWALDGSLEWVPTQQDFPHVTAGNYGLHEIKVARWGGNVFVNPDPDALPLEQSLGALPSLFADYPTDQRHTVLHFRKKIRCNWKIAQEAFMESYHVLETHWDGMPFFGAAFCQYGEADDGNSHINWLASPSLVPDFWLEGSVSPLDGLLQYCTAFGLPQPDGETIETVADARAYVARYRAAEIAKASGRDFSDKSVAYLIDMVKAFSFPNFHPWWGEGLPWWYRFVPHGRDPEACVMEVRVTQPNPVGRPVPPTAEPIDIDFDERCADFPVLGAAGKIIDQDICNLVQVQKGLHAAKKGSDFMTLARYEESNIRHFHRIYNEILGLA